MTSSPWVDRIWSPLRICRQACCTVFNTRVQLHHLLRAVPDGRRFMINSLFGDRMPDDAIRDLYAVMTTSAANTFKVLAHNPLRMEQWFGTHAAWEAEEYAGQLGIEWPLENVHLGIIAEDQGQLDDRLGPLISSMASHRFIMLQKLQGWIDLTGVDCPAQIYSEDQCRSCSICNGRTTICHNGRYNALVEGAFEVVLCQQSETSAQWGRRVVEQCRTHNVNVTYLE
jgi:Protein of unknown function (DUF5131)